MATFHEELNWPDSPAFLQGLQRLATRLSSVLGFEGNPTARLLAIPPHGSNDAPHWIDHEPGPCTEASLGPLAERVRAWRRCRDAGQRILASGHRLSLEYHETGEGEFRYLGSLPTRRSGADVLPLIRMDHRAMESVPNMDGAPIDHITSIEGSRSLVAASFWRLLEEAGHELTRDRPGYYIDWFDRNVRGLLREAGSRLLIRAEMMNLDVLPLGSMPPLGILYSAATEIAGTPYEGEWCEGDLIIARPDDEDISGELYFEEPIPLEQSRWARKVLQMSRAPVGAVCDGATVTRLGSVRNPAQCSDVFVIRFLGDHRWELRFRDRAIMRVEYGVPSLPAPPIEPAFVDAEVTAWLGHDDPTAVARIRTVVVAASRTRHGTLVVIDREADAQATRLAGQSTLVRRVELNADLVNLVAGIDGAIFLDADGMCRAVGVILDGITEPDVGTRARGARYNSAARYVRWRGRNALAFVVSEDGGVDCLPERG